MKFKYDKRANLLKFEHWAGNFLANPLYLLRCKCGFPIKAYFAGKIPLPSAKMDSMGFGLSLAKAATFSLLTHGNIGWGFVLRSYCPTCDTMTYCGPDKTSVIERFIRRQLHASSSNKVNRDRVLEFMAQVEKLPELKQRLFFQTDELSDRPDTALIVSCSRHEMKQVLIDAKINMVYQNIEYWTEGATENHFDIENDILATHGEECTCNLCME